MPLNNHAADVLVRTAGSSWQRPTAEGYVNEDELQRLLCEQPSLIEGISESAVALREFSTGVGPADLVVVDVDGTITVVECKLARNPQIQRAIMGQVLDYASRLSEMTPDDFVRQWSAQSGPSLDVLFDGSPDGGENLATNLRAGIFTLALAVDAINDDLRRIVRYLNSHTSAGMRLLAIELRRAVHGPTEILIPTVYGSESADEKNARRGEGTTTRWTHAEVDVWLRDRDAALADAVASFEGELVANGFRVQGGGSGMYPSYSIWGLAASGAEIAPLSVYCGDRPVLGCNFQWTAAAGEPALARFLDDLIAAGAPLNRDVITRAGYRKRVSIPLELLIDPALRAAFVSATRRLSDQYVTTGDASGQQAAVSS